MIAESFIIYAMYDINYYRTHIRTCFEFILKILQLLYQCILYLIELLGTGVIGVNLCSYAILNSSVIQLTIFQFFVGSWKIIIKSRLRMLEILSLTYRIKKVLFQFRQIWFWQNVKINHKILLFTIHYCVHNRENVKWHEMVLKAIVVLCVCFAIAVISNVWWFTCQNRVNPALNATLYFNL